MNLNKVMLIGNLTRDPELKKTPNGQDVCSFGIATSEKWKDKLTNETKERVEFHNLTAWGKLAEICGKYLKKGRQVYVEGRLQTDAWEKDGVKRYSTKIVVDDMIMLGNKGSGAEGSQGASPETGEQGRPEGEEEVKVEDIPF